MRPVSVRERFLRVAGKRQKKSLAGRIFWLYAKANPATLLPRIADNVRILVERRMIYRKEKLMSHSGKKDKGRKEQKKKSRRTLKEKRKIKHEKHENPDKRRVVIPG